MYNEEAWLVLVLYARISITLELIELCEAARLRTGKKRSKVIRNIMQLLEGDQCEEVQA